MLNVNVSQMPGINLNPIQEVPEDVMVANVKEWKVACPQLACPQLASVTSTDGLRARYTVLLPRLLQS
jgi:hypothetical protein